MRDGRVFDVEGLMNKIRNIKTADRSDRKSELKEDELSVIDQQPDDTEYYDTFGEKYAEDDTVTELHEVASSKDFE